MAKAAALQLECRADRCDPLVRYVDDSLLDSRRDRFCPICGLELFENAVDVVSRCIAADLKDCADLFVGQPLGQHLEYLELARGQRRTRHAVCETCRDS